MPNSKNKEDHALIKRLYVAGAMGRQISVITGFAPNTVHRHILMFRDYIKCKHDTKTYLCEECRTSNRHKRRSLASLRAMVEVANDR